jgi:hypothetical protein
MPSLLACLAVVSFFHGKMLLSLSEGYHCAELERLLLGFAH